MHIEPLKIDVNAAVNAGAMSFAPSRHGTFWMMMLIGSLAFLFGLIWAPHEILWAAFYTNTVFWMGLSIGMVMITVILQIVGATWGVPVRRIAESGIAFLPYGLLCIIATYFGKEHLYFWGHSPMPGREWWMQPEFVFVRHTLCLGILIFFLYRFVRLGLRADIGMARERAGERGLWRSYVYDDLVAGWRGADEVKEAYTKRAYRAPVMMMLYAVIYSLFAFEMIMGMDPVFFANMFGGFVFIGNIYAGWAVLTIAFIYLRNRHPAYAAMTGGQQFHDLGKLTFGFGILWAYLFLAHFLPIWYGNLPEETQWVIVRLREEPWRSLAWACFSMCFIIPFISLLSRDIKKTPFAMVSLCLIILCGLWLERYILIMPQVSPHAIPFGLIEIGLGIGFFGGWLMSVDSFLSKYPIVPISDPRIGEKHHH
jgi:hypothetical protein